MTMESKSRLAPSAMGLRAIKEIKKGDVVFPGFGIPMLTIPQQYLPPELEAVLISENGLIGYGPIITEETDWEPELTTAGGHPVTCQPGACFTDVYSIFLTLSGRRRIDITFLGAYEVSERGDIANWMTRQRGVASIGGVMDVAVGAKKLVVMMPHTTSTGSPKIVKECHQPITAKGVANLIITDLAVIKVTPNGLLLTEIAPGTSVEEVQGLTEPELAVSDELSVMNF